MNIISFILGMGTILLGVYHTNISGLVFGAMSVVIIIIIACFKSELKNQ